jgi:GNAT superfamily N-acetyltransferase
VIVRTAVESDIASIIAGIEDFVTTSSYALEPLNKDHVEATLQSLLAMDDGLVAVMENDAGVFCGAFVGLAHAHLFSGRRMLGELFLYTTRAARGHGSKLRRFAEDWARDNECKAFLIAHPMSEMHLQRVYGRWGFKSHEVHYWKDLV